MLPFASVEYTVIRRDRFFYPRLHHEDWTVYIVIRGSFRCTVCEKTEDIFPGDVFVIPPNEEFDREVTKSLLVHFIRFTLQEDTPLPFPLPVGKVRYADSARVESTVELLNRSPELPAEQQNLCVRHCIEDLFLQYEAEQRLPSKRPGAPEDETVRSVMEYLNEHFREPIRLTDVAARHHISPSGLIKKFRKTVGVPPQRYLMEQRIRQSKRLLTDTSLSVGEIAARTGFENVYYFSKTFKKETGKSPSEYRKNYLL